MNHDRRLVQRRRSPGWVRNLSCSELHSVAFRLRRESYLVDLTARQEWLWDALMSELAYRQRARMRDRTRGLYRFCTCELCMQPPVGSDDLGRETPY